MKLDQMDHRKKVLLAAVGLVAAVIVISIILFEVFK